MSSITTVKPQSLSFQRHASPPSAPRPRGSADEFVPSTFSQPTTYSASWAPAARAETRAQMSGLQVGALALGVLAAFGGIIGVATSGGTPTPPAPSPVQLERSTTTQSSTPVELAKPAQEVQEQPSFSEGRSLLVDRSAKVRSGQFNPDPAQATEMRGSRPLFEESYISSLLDRDLTELPESAPRFTALGVDEGQSSKIYFDTDLNPVGFGYGNVKSESFLTRPSRMNGRGAGLNDQISQYQLSCIYRLENSVELDGVRLEPGVYRLITMEPTSQVATPAMQRGVCPGHRLIPTGSGFAGDYKPVQTNQDGQTQFVNPDDIVQVWTLSPAEAARYQ